MEISINELMQIINEIPGSRLKKIIDAGTLSEKAETEQVEEDLFKPCPFCGGEAQYKVSSCKTMDRVDCLVCDATKEWFDFGESKRHWNRRIGGVE